MSTNIFHEPSRKLPKSDPRILKQDLTKQDQGGRVLPKTMKNTLVIKHVQG